MMQVFNRFRFFLIGFSLLVGLTACGPNYHFSTTIDISNDAWSYDQVLDFEFEITDTLQIYNLLLDITHDKEYSYQNLYTRIGTFFPSGQNIKETLSLELASKTGEWQGDCGSRYCKVQIPIQEGAFFNQAGKYKISLEQFMRKNPIQGINKISFHIEETKNKREATGPKE